MLINKLILFIAPLLVASLLHHFIIIKNNKLAYLARPIDNNKKLGGKAIFGSSKTWRGLIFVSLSTAIFTQLLSSIIDLPSNIEPLIFGAILGFGYSFGELPNSFIKRRLNINASKTNYKGAKKIFYLIDQVDSIIFAIIALRIIYPASWELIIYIFIIGTILHLIFDLLLYKHGYKKLQTQ